MVNRTKNLSFMVVQNRQLKVSCENVSIEHLLVSMVMGKRSQHIFSSKCLFIRCGLWCRCVFSYWCEIQSQLHASWSIRWTDDVLGPCPHRSNNDRYIIDENATKRFWYDHRRQGHLRGLSRCKCLRWISNHVQIRKSMILGQMKCHQREEMDSGTTWLRLMFCSLRQQRGWNIWQQCLTRKCFTCRRNRVETRRKI